MGGNKKILVVDDEEDLVEILAIRLEVTGYSVEKANDGEEGLRKIREWAPDLVLLDIVMPKMNGMEVFREMKKDPKIKDIPVIVLSAKFCDVDMTLDREVGLENYMIKPFDMEELLKRVKERLGG